LANGSRVDGGGGRDGVVGQVGRRKLTRLPKAGENGHDGG